jgi:U3 small nucleolar RNA-associated protein 3
MLQASKALNLSLYLLLKADQASNASTSSESGVMFMDDDIADDVRNHPVIDRLNQLSKLTDKLDSLEENTSGLKEQFRNLVKAANLISGGDVSSSDDDSENDDRAVNVGGSDEGEGSDAEFAIEEQVDPDEATESSSDSEVESAEAIQRRVMTEARFALRNQDIDQDNAKSSKRKRRLAPSSYDYGDETEELTEKAVAAGRKLASTMNSISQKSATSHKKKNNSIGDEAEGDEEEYEQLQRGLSMMEAEFGGGSDDDNDDGASDDDGEGEGFGDDDDDDDFYQKIKSKSLAKKKTKKEMYAVAPKYPRLDNEVEGERTIGRIIMKNRGLVAHKPKINRNPRVKKREQYRKALIRRKGAVREIRTEEGHVYGGESTGIKSGISRSRKL